MMRSSSLPKLPNYVVRITCLIPPSTSPLPLNSSESNLTMTTQAKTLPANSIDLSSLKPSTFHTTCNICERLLYSFEEILICRMCDGSYHWRCIKPDMISHYGENAHFICDKCNESITGTTTTTTGSTHRQTNGGMKIKSTNALETDYRESASTPSKLNTTPITNTSVIHALRYSEDTQQSSSSPQKLSKANDSNGHLSLQSNGQFTDDGRTVRRNLQQQQRSAYTDDVNTPIGMFHANYHYTPLKEYAAMRNGRTANDINTNGYQNSPPTDSDRQLSSHYNSGSRYTSHAYESSKSPLVESSNLNETHFSSPTIDNLTVHNRRQHYISTTNLNVNDKSSPHQQPVDRHSMVGSDSGIVITNASHQQQPHTTDDNQIIEKKLTNLVQQIGRQLEFDAQKLSDKLELKLKNLEHMIHQQTYIIRQQDEVIERLKSQILKIETERDHFRDRLSIHEPREQDDKKYLPTETEQSTDHKTLEQDEQQQTLNDASTNRKYSTTSSVTTDNSRRSTKKTPAPRIDQHTSLVSNENEPTVSKLIKAIPANQQAATDVTSPSIATKLASSVPLLEQPAAANRLDHIIHQSSTDNRFDSTSSYYNLAEVRQYDPKQTSKPISIGQVVTSIHRDDDNDEQIKAVQRNSDTKLQRSASFSSSSSSSSALTPVRVESYDLTTTNNIGLSARNSNLHRSLEVLPRKTSETEQVLKATNKTTSLELGTKPVRYDDPTSIYITPQEAAHPASQYQNVIQGWLRKQNRDSIFKRVERYYCVLSKNALLMHKHDHDRMPYKVVNLQGAKVLRYEDPKYGPSLELTWSARQSSPKHYHFYPNNAEEAEKWFTGIATAIRNLDDTNKWQQYRMTT